MAAPLVDRSTGDTIPAADHNDVKDYIEDGTYRVNTLSLQIGSSNTINSSGDWVGNTIGETVGGTGQSTYAQGDILYSDTTNSLTKLNKGTAGQVLTMNVGATAPNWAVTTTGAGIIGQVTMFALSMSGSVTKATLQGAGWAICDGTTPVSQGITSPTIATTPNLEHTFMRMSDNETSGGTGGSDTHTLTEAEMPSHTHSYTHYTSGGSSESGVGSDGLNAATTGSKGGDTAHNNLPTYYEMAFFMKVK